MTIRLILVTHASTAATAAARFPLHDEPLDARGRDAAAMASGALPRADRVCHGPERRCAQTTAALGFPTAAATACPSLADLDPGAWKGRTLAELQAECPSDLVAWLTDPDAAPHGGESLSALVDRVAGWLGERGSEGPSRIVAIAHPAVVRAAVLHTLGAPASCFWRIDAGPLTQTRLSHHGGRWQLRETGHTLSPAADAVTE